MINFVQPAWVASIIGITVPIIIHLWNVKRGKTLKVGSIDLLIKSASSYAIGLKISDLLLLLLRCLLLAVLSFLLMEPFLSRQDNALKQKGWLLIPRQELGDAYSVYAKTIDSLQQQGYVLHYFEKGFSEGTLSDSSQKIADSSMHTSYRILLKELDQQVPASLPVYIITDDLQKHFGGKRIPVSLQASWRSFTKIPADTNHVIDSSSSIITVYTDAGSAGGNYVRSALEAIRDEAKRNIRVIMVHDISSIPKDNNWLFWLSDSPMPSGLPAQNIFVYERGKPEADHSMIITAGKTGWDLQGLKKIKHTADTSEVPVWTNSYGATILGKEKSGAYTTYHFYSRFDPQWNNLVWSDRFPQLIYDLVFNNTPGNRYALTGLRIDEQQILPVKPDTGVITNKKYLAHTTDLIQYAWWLLLLLFVTERWISHSRNKKEVARG